MANAASTSDGPERLLVVGGSAGALAPLLCLLEGWRLASGLAIVVVLHRRGSPSTELEQLLTRLELPITGAEDRSPLVAGAGLMAPPDCHLLVEDRSRVALSLDPPHKHCRPAIDVTLVSAARCFGSQLTALILSGANDDGALGARAVAERGGRVCVQDPEQAEVPHMPRAVLDAVPEARRLSNADILEFLEREDASTGPHPARR